jgi:hypothetical protein
VARTPVIIDDAGRIPLGGNGKHLVTETRTSRRPIQLPSEPVHINLNKSKEDDADTFIPEVHLNYI